MLIDRNSGTHLYIQVADSIRRTITSGGFPEGSALPSEEDLCKLYGVSRYPMRQAMDMLVKEGFLWRVRGKGTFVTDPAKASMKGGVASERKRLLALVLPELAGDYPVDILRGFENTAGEGGYSAIVATSGAAEAECGCIERVIACGAAGVILYPCSETIIKKEMLASWSAKGVYLSAIERNAGLDDIDYIGSDNGTSGYTAAYHMRQRGFENAVFVSGMIQIPAAGERFYGFQKGLQHFGMRLLNADTSMNGVNFDQAAFSLEGFAERAGLYRKHLPFAVFTSDDSTAVKVVALLQEKGMTVGKDAGVIGFGNSSVCENTRPPLTSIAQNGYMTGEAAAGLAIRKIESGSKQIVRHILPAQLIARQSCGEGSMRI
jgi:GntR family transcriptional regulator, arabinose operon transcriptional repressor